MQLSAAAVGAVGSRPLLIEPRPTCIINQDELPSFVDIFTTIALH